MNKFLRSGTILMTIVTCIGCDQATKTIAKMSLSSSSPFSLFNGYLRFEYTENAGAFLSLGANLSSETRFILLVVFASIALLVTLIFAVRTNSLNTPQLIGLSLFIGGGTGNLIDRIIYNGVVVDFVSIRIGLLQTGIFNVADVAITTGIFVVLVFSFVGRSVSPIHE